MAKEKIERYEMRDMGDLFSAYNFLLGYTPPFSPTGLLLTTSWGLFYIYSFRESFLLFISLLGREGGGAFYPSFFIFLLLFFFEWAGLGLALVVLIFLFFPFECIYFIFIFFFLDIYIFHLYSLSESPTPSYLFESTYIFLFRLSFSPSLFTTCTIGVAPCQ